MYNNRSVDGTLVSFFLRFRRIDKNHILSSLSDARFRVMTKTERSEMEKKQEIFILSVSFRRRTHSISGET